MTLPEIHFRNYSEEQWAAICHQFSRIGVDADAVTLSAGDLMNHRGIPPVSARHVLEAKARSYLLSTKIFDKQYESRRTIARLVVKHSQRLRAAVQDLDLGDKQYAGDLIRGLEKFEDGCNENIIRKFPSEDDDADTFIRSALVVYVEACAEAFPDSKPRYKIGNENGPTIGFLYAASRPVLGNETPTKRTLQMRLRRITREDPDVVCHRDGKPYRELKIQRIKKYLQAYQDNIAKQKRDAEEEEIEQNFFHAFAEMRLALEYLQIEEALSRTLASHPEALAIVHSTLQELSEPLKERARDRLSG